MCDENIRTTLRDYVKDKNKWFYWYHDINRLEKIWIFKPEGNEEKEDEDPILKEFKKKHGDPIEDVLVGFLNSTLDEARLKKANDFASYALYISDKRSFAYFRRAESKREMSGEIDFDKQRDHAVHTLYNYLLGWYVFDHLKEFREAFRRFFKNSLEITLAPNKKEKQFYTPPNNYYPNRPYGLDDKNFFADLPLVNHFGDVWPLASLLHDVGYILEGSLSPASPKTEHERVINGAKVLHDYSNHWLWRHTTIDFRAAINIAINMNCIVPDYKSSKSMSALSDRLRDIGNLENIRKKGLENKKEPLNPEDTGEYALNLEAFELWKLFYKKYIDNVNIGLILIENDIKNTKGLIIIENEIKSNMGLILQEVIKEYENDVWEGGITTKINLNHGVSGGLMLLQASTFWYEFMWGLESTNWNYIHLIQEEKRSNDPVSEKVFEKIQNEITRKRIPAHIWLREEKGFATWTGLRIYGQLLRLQYTTTLLQKHGIKRKRISSKLICKQIP